MQIIIVVRDGIRRLIEKFESCLPTNKILRNCLVLLLAGFLLFELSIWLAPLPYHSLFRPTSTLVFSRDKKLIYAFTSDDDMWRIRTSLSEISPALQQFIVAYEDKWFYWHPGVNPVAILRALRQNIMQRRIVSGGSTLTMQIARIMEPKQRVWYNKIIEIFRAFQLSQRYSKKQLLEIYFNIAPYGGNIEGVAAASWMYFGKEPKQLSYAEAALLAAIPNSPTQLRPDLHPKRAQKARGKVLKYLLRKRLIKKVDYQQAVKEEVPTYRQTWPAIAHHLCYELKRANPFQARIYSTINLDNQLLAEDFLKAHIGKLETEGITNGAVVVIDNLRHELLAAVGSAEFYNRINQGQVNGFLAPRSPGSALKPFIFALGLDKGLITPYHYLEDVPVDFGGYTPENYDRKNNGIVSAKEALERSLNVPAINLLAQLKDDNLHQLLCKAHFSTITPEDRYGLPIAIGGCEITLLELTSLYSALASEGEYIYPKLKKEQVANIPVKLFSSGAAYVITDVLTGLNRPDLPACWEFTSLPKVAWKTGTSYGNRDAWSIGYNVRYTIGVWVGNFSGEGRSAIIGAETAAPLLFDLFNKISSKNKRTWFSRPVEVERREVCALSGQKPGLFCKNIIWDYYLTGASPDVECRFHQAALLDVKTGYRLPAHYASLPNKTKEMVFIKWPPRIGSWLERNGRSIHRLPPLLPEWQKISPGNPPIIRSPLTDYEYQLREGAALQFQKICLDAAAPNDVRHLYWFIDGKLFGKTVPGEKLFYLPQTGRHRVVCQDDQGRYSEVMITVKD